MKAKVQRATAVAFATRDKDNGWDFDWEGAVRVAFLDGCLMQGLRAEAAQEALRDAARPPREAALREQASTASLDAALGWLRLETCFARYGELAALAFARCLDEAELDLRVSERPKRTSTPRSSGVLSTHPAVPALAIIQRGRERLSRFWAGPRFRAA
jgi:hypothetical protein